MPWSRGATRNLFESCGCGLALLERFGTRLIAEVYCWVRVGDSLPSLFFVTTLEVRIEMLNLRIFFTFVPVIIVGPTVVYSDCSTTRLRTYEEVTYFGTFDLLLPAVEFCRELSIVFICKGLVEASFKFRWDAKPWVKPILLSSTDCFLPMTFKVVY